DGLVLERSVPGDDQAAEHREEPDGEHRVGQREREIRAIDREREQPGSPPTRLRESREHALERAGGGLETQDENAHNSQHWRTKSQDRCVSTSKVAKEDQSRRTCTPG